MTQDEKLERMFQPPRDSIQDLYPFGRPREFPSRFELFCITGITICSTLFICGAFSL